MGTQQGEGASRDAMYATYRKYNRQRLEENVGVSQSHTHGDVDSGPSCCKSSAMTDMPPDA
eukprot:8398222-Karenia_brevis.AAC.1